MSEIVTLNTGSRQLLRWHVTRETVAALLRGDGAGDCLYFDNGKLRVELTLHRDEQAAREAATEFRNDLAAVMAMIHPEGQA